MNKTLRPSLHMSLTRSRLCIPRFSAQFSTSPSRKASSSSSTPKDIPQTFPTLPRIKKASSNQHGALPDIQVDHLVVGGGVVGLAITHELAKRFPDKSTFMVERHKRPGEETSSRNSEVIHAGLYYPPSSLKTNLCLRGRELMYEFCKEHGVPHKQTGKFVVGNKESHDHLQGIINHVKALDENVESNLGAVVAGRRQGPPLQIISGDEARQHEKDIGPEIAWVLDSSRTGIVDSHELMATLEKLTLDSESAEIVYDTSVVGIKPLQPTGTTGKRGSGDESMLGWIVETQTEGGEVDQLKARHVINASGLNGPAMLNALARDGYFGEGEGGMIGMWYSKGNYASYSRAKGGVDSVQRLIYPLPDMGGSKDKHGHQGLGTHLTVDLNGNIRFGPDTDWLRPPDQQMKADWWNHHMVALQPSSATINQAGEEERLDAMYESVTSYLPNIKRQGLSADYAGVRPKLVGPAGGFSDFTILHHTATQLQEQKVKQLAFNQDDALQSKDARDALYVGSWQDSPQPSLITLCGIESPGLTSSLALAEVVSNLIGRRGWGTRLDAKSLVKGAQNEHAGMVDQWA